MPPWVRLALPALYIYAFATFAVAVREQSRRGERAVTYERRVGAEQAGATDVDTIRVFSELWLVLFALPGVFVRYVSRDARLAAPADRRVDAPSRRAAV